MWRLVSRAFNRRDSTRAWIQRWVPPDVMSGQRTIAALDLAKAFDWVDPEELCSMFAFLDASQVSVDLTAQVVVMA